MGQALAVDTSLLTQCRNGPIVLDEVLPDLCPALAEIILHRMQTARKTTPSLNVGGWKSPEDFFSWSDAAVQSLREWVAGQLGSSKLVAWAMVNRAGSYHPRHQHRVASLTGIYYVAAGSEDSITPTIFEIEDARGKKLHDLEVDPHPGRLVIFRGETWHSVPPYPGDLPRITIAFDVRR